MSSASFADIAVALRCAGSSMALDVEQSETLVVRLNSPGVDRAMRELREQAMLIGEAHDLFRALVDYENEVRALAARQSIYPERSIGRRVRSGMRRLLAR